MTETDEQATDATKRVPEVVKLESTRADLQKEREGDEIPSQIYPGVRWRVRAANYRPFEIAFNQGLERLRRKNKGDPVPSDEINELMGREMANHLLLGWSGFDVPYSPAKAVEILSDRSYRKIISDVRWAANQVGESDLELVRDAAKN